mmetsp:Transcript_43459/g.70512  ORF Transcript_43459/g.70512 Transcript_43459/m.70512 type:complete len:500 (+) Transcript_43459:197-1696(+)|eukprot:CAMPEP_0184651628 /NCGR_PEP_ID=MMETSP0308-20130426/9266_1 /TAXON_ID=38269 /ORGANISM="Gloeochaete witrockiana, Strain SAG 46.84" /LENGTH=499 /DNA_ID=CAMNT_0027085993 /DNA_START=197 /DNA_END=1696 /DNA_ORIENTATION=-
MARGHGVKTLCVVVFVGLVYFATGELALSLPTLDTEPAPFCGHYTFPNPVFSGLQHAIQNCRGHENVVRTESSLPVSISYTSAQGTLTADGYIVLAVIVSTGRAFSTTGTLYFRLFSREIPYYPNKEPQPEHYDYSWDFPANSSLQTHVFQVLPDCYVNGTDISLLVRFDYTANSGDLDNLYIGVIALLIETDPPTVCKSAPTPAPTLIPTPTPPVSDVWGDPHFRTFDGVGVTYAQCGDYVLSRPNGPVGESGATVQYHGRFCARGNEASSTCAVGYLSSMETNISKAEVYAMGKAFKLLVDGKGILLPAQAMYTSRNGLTIERNGQVYEFLCPTGTRTEVFLQTENGFNYLDLSLTLSSIISSGNLVGLLGSHDGDVDNEISYRDGRPWHLGHGLSYVTAVDQPSLNDVQQSWAVQQDETIFTLSPLQSQAQCAQKHNSARKLLVMQKDTAAVLEATKACELRNLQGLYLKTCIFDYLATGGSVSFMGSSALFASRS